MVATVAPTANAVIPPDTGASESAERVLGAAVARFAKYGYAGTSIRDIASDLGINSATLYAHFASKSDILRELVRIGHEGMDRRIRAALALVSDQNASTKLRAVMEADVLLHTDYVLLGAVVHSQIHLLSDEQAAQSYEIRRGLRDLTFALVDEGVASGEFTAENPRLGVRAATDMVHGLVRWYSPEIGDAEALARQYGTYVLKLVGAVGV